MSHVADRLSALKREMTARGVTHYLVPSADEHINEYLPPWRERRRFLSGFTGSAGDLLVSVHDGQTWLFTDGRYHLQAEQELRGTEIGLQRVGAKDAKNLLALLQEYAREQRADFVLGVDAAVLTVSAYESIATAVAKGGGSLRVLEPNLVDQVWSDRPGAPTTPLIECPLDWVGASVDEKVADLRASLGKVGADALVTVKLDQIAWLLNLRSLDDIPYNPVFEAFLYVDATSVHVFVRSPDRRLPPSVRAVKGLVAHEYDEWRGFLSEVSDRVVLVDASGVTEGVRAAIRDNPGVRLVHGDSPIEVAKARKNDVESERMRHANLMASVAKTKALLWLQQRIAQGDAVTERSFKDFLEERYAEIDGYRGLSFNTISSTGEHGAIIHYAAADDTPLCAGELFLIDSGIQMDGGTTDDTRTVAVGAAAQLQRDRYTAVLRAHIRGASQRFPAGTAGAAIDAITRSALWSQQLHYDHGTGHGVGCFLNVHEGPFGIAETSRRSYATRPLEPGMVTSIEPGYYASGFGGIRIENLYQVERVEGDPAGGREWLRFAPLTWIPFDPALIDAGQLDREEREWLAWYHGECQARLAAHLSPAERAGLAALIGGAST